MDMLNLFTYVYAIMFLPITAAYGFVVFLVYEYVIGLPYITVDFALIIESVKAFFSFINYAMVVVGLIVEISIGTITL